MEEIEKPEEKALPAPEEELDLPAPDEKLLPAPTFLQQYGKVLKYVFLSLVLLISFSSGGYLVLNKQALIAFPEPTDMPTPTAQVACPQDARICPDGSSVGRSGPKCEFNACPTTQTASTSGTKEYTDKNYQFSLEIPTTWVAQDDSDGTLFGPLKNTDEDGKSITPYIDGTLWFDYAKLKPGIVTVQDVEKRYVSCKADLTNPQLKETTKQIGKKTVLLVTNSVCGKSNMAALVWMDDTNSYLLETYQKYADVLSTFTFTDQDISPTSPVLTPPPGCYYKVCNKMCIKDNPNCCQTPDNLICNVTPTDIPHGD